MEENLAIPFKNITLKHNSLNSFWYESKDIKDYPKSLKSGDFVKVYGKNGKFLATGFVNLDTYMALRIFSIENTQLTKKFIKEKILSAYKKREKLKNFTDSFRIVNSDADLFPGLIIDKFKDIFVVQINTAGMENLKPFIISSLKEIFNPQAIYEKSDEKMRKLEGLPINNGIIYGDKIDEIIINEFNVKYSINLKKSQKTGFYLDQRKNRKIISEISSNKDVLDLFCYTGGFGINCALNNAKFIKFVEISKDMISFLKKNLELNNITENFEIINSNVFKFLENENRKYDLIIIDPPSFAKTKNEKKGAIKGYKYLLDRSLEILNKNGFLAIFSCSYHIDLNDLINSLKEVCFRNNNIFEIKEFLFQDFTDHPYIVQIPQTLYLKGILLEKIK